MQNDHSASRNAETLRRDAPHLLATAEDDRSTRERATLRILELVDEALENGATVDRDQLGYIRQLARWLYADLPRHDVPIHDDEEGNRQRAILAAHALRAFGTAGFDVEDPRDLETLTADLVCDLGHLLAQRAGNGDVFETMLDRARRHFYEEIALARVES